MTPPHRRHNILSSLGLSCLISGLALCQIPNTLALVPAPIVHTAIGACAGSLGALAAYPLDFVKSQLQTERGREKYSDGFECAADIVRNSPVGPLALYRGALVNVVGIMPEKTIKLGTNDFSRGLIMAHYGYLPIFGEIIAGGIAGACQVVVTNPLEVVKVKLQTSDLSISDTLGDVFRNNFLGKLYRGSGACIARDVLFSAILFPLYAHIKTIMPVLIAALVGLQPASAAGTTLVAPQIPAHTGFLCDIIAGSVAAAPAAFLATPADVVKTRMQQSREKKTDVNGDDVPEDIASSPKANFVQVASSILSTEGVPVFFSGWAERVIRSIPQFGVTLAMFDVLTEAAIKAGLLLPVLSP